MLKYSRLLIGLAVSSAATALWGQDDFLSEEDLYGLEIENSNVVYDPFESINRITFKVNDVLYLEVFEPIARGYEWVTPDPVELGFRNFFRNLRYPIRLSGNLLQGRLQGAWVETGRFAINSTAGIAGIFTPADNVKGFAPIPPEGIGQALGAWGIGEGPFLVIPVLGPANLRDAFAALGDLAVHPIREPFSLIDHWSWEWKTLLRSSEIVVGLPALLGGYKEMKGMAIDPYSSLKNGYSQLRRAAIAD